MTVCPRSITQKVVSVPRTPGAHIYLCVDQLHLVRGKGKRSGFHPYCGHLEMLYGQLSASRANTNLAIYGSEQTWLLTDPHRRQGGFLITGDAQVREASQVYTCVACSYW